MAGKGRATYNTDLCYKPSPCILKHYMKPPPDYDQNSHQHGAVNGATVALGSSTNRDQMLLKNYYQMTRTEAPQRSHCPSQGTN